MVIKVPSWDDIYDFLEFLFDILPYIIGTVVVITFFIITVIVIVVEDSRNLEIPIELYNNIDSMVCKTPSISPIVSESLKDNTITVCEYCIIEEAYCKEKSKIKVKELKEKTERYY